MSENNDYIQLPPLKKDTPSDVVAFMWEYMKVPENSREKVKNLLKDANENGVKLSHQAPTLYDVVQKEEIRFLFGHLAGNLPAQIHCSNAGNFMEHIAFDVVIECLFRDANLRMPGNDLIRRLPFFKKRSNNISNRFSL